MFEVIRPNVTINKGIVGYNATGLTLGGVTFNPPDGPTSFSGTPVYTRTQALAIGASDSLLLSDAGDRVRYAIVLQNEGRGDAYDVTVTDTIPASYVRPATLTAANFCRPPRRWHTAHRRCRQRHSAGCHHRTADRRDVCHGAE